MLASLLALVLAAPLRIAVLPIAAGEGVTDKTASALTEALAAEVRRKSGGEVITQREINTVLSLERQKEMMGCATEACMAELGGALGVERLVNGDIARVGESLLVHFRVVEVAKVRVSAQADRRLRGGTFDDLLDALPTMVSELFGDAGQVVGAAPAKPPTQTVTVTLPPAAAKPLPPPWVEERDAITAAQVEKLSLWQDGEGRYVASIPLDLDAPIFSGTAKKLHRVWTSGGFRNDQTSELRFWEPRHSGRGDFSVKPEGASLSCGGRSVPLKAVPAAEAKKILARAELLAPRWRRLPEVLARDDQGIYFYVDAARRADNEEADPPDFRLYVGKKGALARIEIEDVVRDGGGLVVVTKGGRLVQHGQQIEWATGQTRTRLTSLDSAQSAPLIYKELGVYQGEALGTPCDGHL